MPSTIADRNKFLADMYLSIDARAAFRERVLECFPDMLLYLYDLSKPMRLNDLSYIRCVEGDEYEYERDRYMLFHRMFDIRIVKEKARFTADGRVFETSIVMFEPNNL